MVTIGLWVYEGGVDAWMKDSRTWNPPGPPDLGFSRSPLVVRATATRGRNENVDSFNWHEVDDFRLEERHALRSRIKNISPYRPKIRSSRTINNKIDDLCSNLDLPINNNNRQKCKCSNS